MKLNNALKVATKSYLSMLGILLQSGMINVVIVAPVQVQPELPVNEGAKSLGPRFFKVRSSLTAAVSDTCERLVRAESSH